jgi:hypothetical protein
MTWKKVILTRDQVKQGHLDRIREAWMPLMLKSGNSNLVPPSMGEASRDGITNIYFSPETSPFWDEITSKYGAVSCETPAEHLTPMVRLNQPSN